MVMLCTVFTLPRFLLLLSIFESRYPNDKAVLAGNGLLEVCAARPDLLRIVSGPSAATSKVVLVPPSSLL